MEEREIQDRKDLASFLRGNAEMLAGILERECVTQYPHSRANSIDVEDIHGWTLSELGRIARLMETGDPTLCTFVDYYGDQLVDPHNTDLSPFVNFLSTIMFMARTIAPNFFQKHMTSPSRTRRFVDLFERTYQGVIRYNCGLFADAMGQPGALSRSWDMLAGMISIAESDAMPAPKAGITPLQRFGLDSTKGSEAGDDQAKGDAQDMPPVLDALSRRECEVVDLIVEGESNGEIAATLDISLSTVKNHISRIFDKLNVNSRTELTALVLRGADPKSTSTKDCQS